MKIKTSSLLVAGALFGAFAVPVQADPMLDLLKVLRDKGTISADDYSLLANAAKAREEQAKATEAEVLKKVEDAEKRASVVSIGDRGLSFTSTDGAFTANIGGRIHADYAAVDDDRDAVGDGSRFRRTRLGMQGTFFKDWVYKAEVDFSANSNSQNTLTDMYLGYKGFSNTEILLGRHKMPSGLEELTSSNNITFMERSMVTNAFARSRQNGLSAKFNGDNWSMTLAGHLDGNQRNNTRKNEDTGFGARLTFAPLSSGSQHIHLGTSWNHVNFNKTNEIVSGSAKTREPLTRSTGPEISVADSRFTSNAIANRKHSNIYGLEAAAIFGPASLQSEYFKERVNTDGKNADLDGYYVQASYILTGESRGYNPKSGGMSGVSPKGIVGQGGIGAWELALRYSDIDLTNASNATRTKQGVKGDTWAFGVNWYATRNIRFMANYVQSETKPVGGKSEDIKAFQLRGQVAF